MRKSMGPTDFALLLLIFDHAKMRGFGATAPTDFISRDQLVVIGNNKVCRARIKSVGQ